MGISDDLIEFMPLSTNKQSFDNSLRVRLPDMSHEPALSANMGSPQRYVDEDGDVMIDAIREKLSQLDNI